MLKETTYSEINTLEEFKEFLNLVNENTPRKVKDCHFKFKPSRYPYYVGLLTTDASWTYNNSPYNYLVIPFKDLKKIIKKEYELEYEIC